MAGMVARTAGALISVVMSGCGLFLASETCAPDAACIPSITWDGATYYGVGSRGTAIAASDTRPLGELQSGVPSEAADGAILALDGVDPSDAIAMRARSDVEVAPGVTVEYLLYIREGEFPAALCQYYAADPPNDPAPPPLPDVCG